MTVAVLMGCLVMMLTACTADNKLKLAIEAGNKQCPINMGLAGEVESMSYDDGEVVFTYVLNENVGNVQAMEENPEVMKRTMRANFANPQGQMKALMDLIKDANASLRLVFKSKNHEESAEITMTPEELKATTDDTSLTAEDKLNAEIEVTNMQLPTKVDAATLLEKVVVEGNEVVYLYQIDESVVDMESLEANAGMMRDNVKNMLENGGEAVLHFMKRVIDTGRSLGYRYTGTESGKKVELVFTNEELQDMLY